MTRPLGSSFAYGVVRPHSDAQVVALVVGTRRPESSRVGRGTTRKACSFYCGPPRSEAFKKPRKCVVATLNRAILPELVCLRRGFLFLAYRIEMDVGASTRRDRKGACWGGSVLLVCCSCAALVRPPAVLGLLNARLINQSFTSRGRLILGQWHALLAGAKTFFDIFFA